MSTGFDPPAALYVGEPTPAEPHRNLRIVEDPRQRSSTPLPPREPSARTSRHPGTGSIDARAAGHRGFASIATRKEAAMLDHPIQFVLALFAGLLGFGGITGPVVDLARILFVILIVVLAVSLLRDRSRKKAPSTRLQAWRPTRWTHHRN
jgi:uncharacterized membrane protein YtjA (UPF0391 family)